MIKKPHIHIQDMLDAIEAIEGISLSKREDYYYLRALERDLAIIGEAANRLPAEFHKKHTSIPWREIINLRHIIVHGYDKILPSALWEIVDDKLPELKQHLQAIMKEIPNE